MNYEKAIQDKHIRNIIYKNLKKLTYFLNQDEIDSEADWCLLEAINSFDPAKGRDFHVWVGNVSYFYSLKLYKANKERTRPIQLDEKRVQVEYNLDYNLSVEDLNEQDRNILLLKYLYRYENKEIAQSLWVTRKKVTNMVKAAHKNFKEILCLEKS